ncbi:MAG: peptide chain release factor N(5)-glutamine methyltransferase [Candidatus Cloacimonetes bacterium]|nr:peptide chain release factor N(5)-glutamine methyltransferase [Candidatus Cloacimonadota bacterium]
MKIWKISEIINWATDLLTSKDIENPKLDSEYIIAHVLGMSRLELNLHQDDDITEDNLVLIQNMISRRQKNEPLQYILGETDFYGLTFKVNEHVLIPRPETELLVEKIIKENPAVEEILEIGTGSGAIAIALAANIKNVKIIAVDISNEALQVARENAVKNKVNINFCFSDVFENVIGKYDLIISNPPYISNKEYQYLSSEIREYEPLIALLADDNGLAFYKKILCSAKDYLTENGKIYFEIGCSLSESIKKVAEENGFRNIETVKDLNDFDRMMVIEA